MKRAKWGTSERERTPSLSLPSQLLGLLGSLICFFCAFHPVFCFLSHQGAWSWARGKIKQREDRSNLCSGKKNPKKKFRLIQDSNILPMQLECCTSISQCFKSCNSQNYFSLSFVASVPTKIFFAFKIILISTCSLHLWVICNVTSSKNFGRKHIYYYCHKTSKEQ